MPKTTAVRKTVCTALIAMQLGGCTSWRAQPVEPRDLPSYVAAQPTARMRFTLGNGKEVVVSQARISGDTILGTTLGQPVRLAMTDVRIVALRRTNVLRSVGLGYAIVLAAGLVCAASGCFDYSVNLW